MTNTGQTISKNNKYKIVFSGDIQPGHDLMSVKARLANSFGVSGAVVEKLFPGKAVLVKGDLTYDDAQLFKMKLEQSGAVLQLLEASAEPRQPAPKPEPPPPPTLFAEPVTPVSPSVSPSGPVLREFSFRQVEKKSSAPKTIAIIVVVIIFLAILGNIGRKNRTGVTGGQQASRPADIFANVQTKLYNDPRNYYSVLLPGNYTLSDKSSGGRSKVTFNYPGENTVSILASPMNKEWRPEYEMITKVEAIKNGKAGPISSFRIERYGLIAFNGMDGYELFLRKGDQIAHSYAMVSLSNTAFSVAIVTSGSASQSNHDTLDAAIRTSLRPN